MKMPFEQKYTSETRESSLARVLERRAAEPGNRSIIRETADEFQVGEQSLRGWIRAWEKTNAPEPAAPAEPAPTPAAAVADDAADAPVAEAPARRGRPSAAGSAAAATDSRVAELEAEVARLRKDRETLKSALAVLLAD